jgi:hypothetical protein
LSVEALQESETELSEPEALRLAGALGGWVSTTPSGVFMSAWICVWVRARL